jgi:hypothetical protein
MMDCRLSVITCDKCGEVMMENQNILIIAEGVVKEAEPELDFHGTGVRYACHLDCWDGVEEDY